MIVYTAIIMVMVASRTISKRDTDSADRFPAAIVSQCQESSYTISDAHGVAVAALVGNICSLIAGVHC